MTLYDHTFAVAQAPGPLAPPPTATPVATPAPTPAPPPPPEGTLIYTGMTGWHDASPATFTQFSQAVGQPVTVAGALPADLSRNRCVVLFLNTELSAADTAALSRYVHGGGTLLAAGEWSGYSDAANAALNELMGSLGVGMSLDYDSLDADISYTWNVEPDPLTEGVSEIYYNHTDDIDVADPARTLIETQDGWPLIATQDVGTGRVVLSGDTNLLADSEYVPDWDANGDDNGVLFHDMCG